MQTVHIFRVETTDSEWSRSITRFRGFRMKSVSPSALPLEWNSRPMTTGFLFVACQMGWRSRKFASMVKAEMAKAWKARRDAAKLASTQSRLEKLFQRDLHSTRVMLRVQHYPTNLRIALQSLLWSWPALLADIRRIRVDVVTPDAQRNAPAGLYGPLQSIKLGITYDGRVQHINRSRMSKARESGISMRTLNRDFEKSSIIYAPYSPYLCLSDKSV